jgi:hypothetical protein
VKRIAVYVATTGGPVLIERITPERAPQSMMCLRRTSTILPVSGDYDDFVRPGSGVIEREFGPFEDHSFRLDVTAPIGAGKSWQLGVFFAHAISASTDYELSTEAGDADEILMLTGQVDHDLNVGSVGHIPEKLVGLMEMLAELGGRPVTWIVPAGENHDAVKHTDAITGVTVIPVNTAWDACRAIGIDAPALLTIAQTPVAAKPRRRLGVASLVAVVAAGALIASYAGSGSLWPDWVRDVTAAFNGGGSNVGVTVAPPSKLKEPRKAEAPTAPEPEQITPSPSLTQQSTSTLRLMAQRPPVGKTCADIQFGGATARLELIKADGDGRYADSRLDALCGLTFEVNAGGASRHVALVLQIHAGRRVKDGPPPLTLQGDAPLSGMASWSIILPRRSQEPFAYSLVLLESDQPMQAQADRLRANAPKDATALVAKGVRMQVIDHKVMN